MAVCMKSIIIRQLSNASMLNYKDKHENGGLYEKHCFKTTE